MPTYSVTKNEITNTIEATEEFVVSQSFDSYELVPKTVLETSTDEEKAIIAARQWRNEELKNSDWIVAVTDHPQRADYITYRETLRSWPADEANFPDTKPTLGE
jgi:hypothetical protein